MQFLKAFHSGALRVFGHPGLANTAHEERRTRRRRIYKGLLCCSNSSGKSAFVIGEKNKTKNISEIELWLFYGLHLCHTNALLLTGTDVQVVCCDLITLVHRHNCRHIWRGGGELWFTVLILHPCDDFKSQCSERNRCPFRMKSWADSSIKVLHSIDEAERIVPKVFLAAFQLIKPYSIMFHISLHVFGLSLA